MSELTTLSPQQMTLMSELLVRVGVYVSHCEDTDMGEESEGLERSHMAKALSRVSAMSKIPSVAQMAEQAQKIINKNFDDSEETLCSDLHSVVLTLIEWKDASLLLEYRKAVMYIAYAVARAYREELDHHDQEFMMETLLNKISGLLNQTANKEDYKNLNISPAEDTALTAISEAMKI